MYISILHILSILSILSTLSIVAILAYINMHIASIMFSPISISKYASVLCKTGVARGSEESVTGRYPLE